MKTNEFKDSTVFIINNSIEYSSGGIVSKQIIQRKIGNTFDALIKVIDGTGEILINKNPFTLKKGESIIMAANVPHAVNAVEKFKMVLTMIKENE